MTGEQGAMEGLGPLREWLTRHGVDAEPQVVIAELYKDLTKAVWSDPCLALTVAVVDRAEVPKAPSDDAELEEWMERAVLEWAQRLVADFEDWTAREDDS